VATLLALASLGLASFRLDLRMEWTYLFDQGDPVVTKFLSAREIFPYPGDIVVLVDGGSKERREAYMDLLAQRLAAEPEVFYHILHRLDFSNLAGHALYYLSVPQLTRLASALEGVSAKAAPQELQLALLKELLTTLEARGRHRPDLLGSSLARELPESARDILERILSGERVVYITADQGRLHLLALKSGTRGSSLDQSGKTVVRLRQILEELRPQAGGLRLRLTGLPVLLHDERVTCAQDSTRSCLLGLVLVGLVFSLGFGGVRRPALAVVALAYGLAGTAGFATLAVGHLNFITVTMATMLLGLGVDFGVHLLFRYEEELGHGQVPEQAMKATLMGTGLDNLVGALATATAFATLTLVDFRGVGDLGVIAAGGILLCFFSTVTVLPALVALFDVGASSASSNRPTPLAAGLGRLEEALLANSRGLLVVTLVATLLALSWATTVGFSYNLLDVQAQTLESVRVERELIGELRRSALSAAVVVGDEDQARSLALRLEALPAVESVSSVLPLVPTEVVTKEPLVKRIVASANALKMPAEIPLDSARDLLELKKLAGRRAKGEAQSAELEAKLKQLSTQLRSLGPGPIQDGLRTFQTAVRGDLLAVLDLLRSQRSSAPTLADLPAELRVRYLSPQGDFLLSVAPASNIWEKGPLDEFLGQVATCTPELVGHPVVSEHILSSFARAYVRAPWLTLLGVGLVMGLYLRRGRDIVLGLLPTGLGVVGVLGAMGLEAVQFNAVNFVALPICVGIGAVYGVHSLHRMTELGGPKILTSSTGPAIFLSGLTTWIGFWCLTLAQHEGMASLGWVISVGVAVNLLVSLLVLPALVNAVPWLGCALAAGRKPSAK
jgi:hopanoid biosynthesis associated RND transporter like protein HpnN